MNYFQISSLGTRIFPFVTAIFPGNCEKNTNDKLCKENAHRGPKTKEVFF